MDRNKINLPSTDFHISYYQISVVIFIERAFEKLYIKNPNSFFSLIDFLELINYQNIAPYWLNDNQIKDVIIKMVDLRKLEEKKGKYRFKKIDFSATNLFLKD